MVFPDMQAGVTEAANGNDDTKIAGQVN
jgi:two-component system nitrogen regulation sensor histidine kinase NtrY